MRRACSGHEQGCLMNRRAVTVVENRALVEVTTVDMREADRVHIIYGGRSQ